MGAGSAQQLVAAQRNRYQKFVRPSSGPSTSIGAPLRLFIGALTSPPYLSDSLRTDG